MFYLYYFIEFPNIVATVSNGKYIFFWEIGKFFYIEKFNVQKNLFAMR